MTQFDAKRLLSLSAATVATALSLGVGSAPVYAQTSPINMRVARPTEL
ncbi:MULTISPECIES: hypothetical protein [unclassified Caballeronia]|jgi:hypothetical protein|nr:MULTISPECIES: hypothetical protein [unclassified Caballeronia]MDR5768067.1 hypothetical protein [Caballeronia sp. LZ028]